MFVKGVPADTSTTAEKSLISSSLSCRAVSFSLNSNMQLSSSPAPMERSRSTLYFLPLRNLTVRSFTSNNDTKRTISTCAEETEESVRGLTEESVRGLTEESVRTLARSETCQDSCCFTSKVPALRRLTWSCWERSWKPGIHLANSTTSRMAGMKLLENSSQISWPGLQGSTKGETLMGHTWERTDRVQLHQVHFQSHLK